MDTATHALVPYALVLLALGLARTGEDHASDRVRDRLALAAVFAVAAAAPDLDGLVHRLRHIEGLYWLQHRGFSHSLLGAPVFGFVAAGALALLARRFPRRLAAFRPRRGWAVAVLVGAWSHLVLDVVTLSGVPALWPVAHARVAFPLYHWLVPWLLFPSALVLALRAWGKLSPRRTAQAGALVMLALVLAGGVRAWTFPWDAPEDALVFPRRSASEWILLHPARDGAWEARLLANGAILNASTFTGNVPPGAEAAVERARDASAYRGFELGAYGPVVVDAEPLPRDPGGWTVTFTAVAQRFEALNDPAWTPTRPHEDWGFVTITVRSDGTTDAEHLGW